ncbi:MAG: HK97 family phage prohead protease, partial [Paracoccus sp. (in: a-proteobacteria)]|nr:HK97 family phage prohead protease [Paracoccus sp. (in: a-proteobacteria)]
MVPGLEVKFAGGAPILSEGHLIEGYGSLFGLTDQGGDAVMPGAFSSSLQRLAGRGDKVRMLWQHDPAKPIGVWDEIREDGKGLWVRGRLLPQ